MPRRRRRMARRRRTNRTYLWQHGMAPRFNVPTSGPLQDQWQHNDIITNDSASDMDRLRLTNITREIQLVPDGQIAATSPLYVRALVFLWKLPAIGADYNDSGLTGLLTDANVTRKLFAKQMIMAAAHNYGFQSPVYHMRIPSITLKPGEKLLQAVYADYVAGLSSSINFYINSHYTGRIRGYPSSVLDSL